LLIAACPIGGISTTWSYLAKASTALSVALTGLSTVFGAVTIPIVGAGIGMALARPFGLSAPIPVLLGQVARPRCSRTSSRAGHPGWLRCSSLKYAQYSRSSRLAIRAPRSAIWSLFSEDGPLAGWLTAALVRSDSRDRFTLAAEFGTRNIGVAMAIVVTLLGRIDFARFATTYALTEVPLMLMGVAVFRRWQAIAAGA
jgi:predicted Na+-dependent transporter